MSIMKQKLKNQHIFTILILILYFNIFTIIQAQYITHSNIQAETSSAGDIVFAAIYIESNDIDVKKYLINFNIKNINIIFNLGRNEKIHCFFH